MSSIPRLLSREGARRRHLVLFRHLLMSGGSNGPPLVQLKTSSPSLVPSFVSRFGQSLSCLCPPCGTEAKQQCSSESQEGDPEGSLVIGKSHSRMRSRGRSMGNNLHPCSVNTVTCTLHLSVDSSSSSRRNSWKGPEGGRQGQSISPVTLSPCECPHPAQRNSCSSGGFL